MINEILYMETRVFHQFCMILILDCGHKDRITSLISS